MTLRKCWLTLTCAGLIGSASAQVTSPTLPAPPVPLVVGAQQGPVLRAGTAVALRTLDELNSKESRVGQRFNLEVADDVRVAGHVVIPAGTRAVGEVTKVVGKGMFGKSGKVFTRLLFIRMGDRELRISGQVGDQGAGGTAATIGAMVVVPVAGFFVTGHSALLAPGTPATGYIESDLPLMFAEAGSTPPPAQMVVPVPPKP